jgi:hypothetical protein
VLVSIYFLGETISLELGQFLPSWALSFYLLLLPILISMNHSGEANHSRSIYEFNIFSSATYQTQVQSYWL